MGKKGFFQKSQSNGAWIDMFDYTAIRREKSKPTNKVLSEPTLVFDFVEIREAAIGAVCFFYFGIVDPKPLLLLAVIIFLGFVWPPIREKMPKGYLLHKMHRYTPAKIPNCIGLSKRTKLRI